jgi:hypothetical protein
METNTDGPVGPKRLERLRTPMSPHDSAAGGPAGHAADRCTRCHTTKMRSCCKQPRFLSSGAVHVTFKGSTASTHLLGQQQLPSALL